MQFTIGTSLSNKNPKHSFVVMMKFMHGDGDAYSTEKVGTFSADTKLDKKGRALEDMIKLMRRIDDLGYIEDNEKLYTLPNFEAFGIDWPGDSTTDFQENANLDEWYVRYFDAAGHEYEVAISD